MSYHFFDWFLPVVYLIILVYIAVLSGKKTNTVEDLFLARGSLGFIIIGFSLFASNISSTTLIGLAGSAYKSGISVANYEWMAGVVLLIAAFIFVPIYLRNKLNTVPEFFEHRFSIKCRQYVSFWMIILTIFVDTSASLFAGALVLKVFFPFILIWPTVIVLGFFAGLYTMVGGLRAVMLSDALQAIILIIGSLLLTLFVFKEFEYSWANFLSSVPESHLNFIKPQGDPNMPWTGLIVGVPILGLYYWCMNHYISQRFFAAKSEDHAKWGAILAAFLKLIPLFIMVLPGVAAISLIPNLERSDEVFPTLVKTYLPPGLRGLIVAAFLAAIMSTIDSTINAASALLHYDFLKKNIKTFKSNLFQARILTGIFMFMAILWAPIINSFPGLFSYLQQMFSIVVPPIVASFLLGLFWEKSNKVGALSSMLIGHLFGIFVTFYKISFFSKLHFLEISGLITIFCLLLNILLSLIFKNKNLKKNNYKVNWKPNMISMTKKYPFYKDYRFFALIFLLLLSILVFKFR